MFTMDVKQQCNNNNNNNNKELTIVEVNDSKHSYIVTAVIDNKYG